MTENELYNKAITFLARREYSQTELHKKLASYCEDEALIDKVIHTLIEQNLQSDERFTEVFIRSKKDRYGRIRLNDELQHHGIAPEYISEFLPDSTDELERAVAILYKKYKQPDSIPIPYAKKAKYAQFLSYRGFDNDTVWHAISQWVEECQE